MTRGNLIHALKFDPVINSDAPLYESRFFIPFNAGVDIRDIKFSNLLILRYIVAPKNLLRCFITAVLQASAEIPCCLVYRSPCKR